MLTNTFGFGVVHAGLAVVHDGGAGVAQGGGAGVLHGGAGVAHGGAGVAQPHPACTRLYLLWKLMGRKKTIKTLSYVWLGVFM